MLIPNIGMVALAGQYGDGRGCHGMWDGVLWKPIEGQELTYSCGLSGIKLIGF
jgi:hypothetical protein